MSATSPTQLSYDVFVSDGPAGAGDERMPDGAPLAWSRPALPGPGVAADPRIDALQVVARWPCEARGPGRGGSAAGAGLDRGVFPRAGGPQARPPVQPGPSRTQTS
jgi:hypothetical protein